MKGKQDKNKEEGVFEGLQNTMKQENEVNGQKFIEGENFGRAPKRELDLVKMDQSKKPNNNSEPNSPPEKYGLKTSKAVAPFIAKLYNLVENKETDFVISWDEDGKTFFIVNPDFFAKEILPRFFKHKNFSSFIRQLNLYGFHKIPNLRQGVLIGDKDSDKLQFYHSKFQRGNLDQLSEMSRKEAKFNTKNSTPTGKLDGLAGELEAVKCNQDKLSKELKEMQLMNDKLWKINQEARAQNKVQQDTINKILHFLGTLFSHDKQIDKPPRKKRLLLEQNKGVENGNQNQNDPNTVFAKLLQDYSVNNMGISNDLNLNNNYYNLPGLNQAFDAGVMDTNNNNNNALVPNLNFDLGNKQIGALIPSLDGGIRPEQKEIAYDKVNQALLNNNNTLNYMNSNLDNLQNNLSLIQNQLNQPTSTIDNNSNLNFDQLLGAYNDNSNINFNLNQNTLFNDNAINGTHASHSLDLDSILNLTKLDDPMGNIKPSLEEDIEEIVTEPPPPSSSLNNYPTSPTHTYTP